MFPFPTYGPKRCVHTNHLTVSSRNKCVGYSKWHFHVAKPLYLHTCQMYHYTAIRLLELMEMNYDWRKGEYTEYKRGNGKGSKGGTSQAAKRLKPRLCWWCHLKESFRRNGWQMIQRTVLWSCFSSRSNFRVSISMVECETIAVEIVSSPSEFTEIEKTRSDNKLRIKLS